MSVVRSKRSFLMFSAAVALGILVPIAAGAAGAEGSSAAAAGSTPTPNPAGRPKLFLVLSGGGARGAAHIGVLKVLEELHVPVDMIVGTSMGSIVGGLYATGWTPDEMEKLLRDVDWKKVFIDRVERDERSYRRRQDDAQYYIRAKIRFKGWKPYLPMGVLGGQRLELFLKSLDFLSTASSSFDDFPIPYRAVAADLGTNEAVVIDHGSLATAMRASMSVAGAFAPVEIDGRVLVDGGAVANLPVGIAQQLGADAVIAVDITSPLNSADELGSFVSVLNQLSSLLTSGNRVEDLKRLGPGDVLIRPELGDISFSDFPRASEAVAIGEKTARAVVDKLRQFSVGDEEWAAYLARHHRPTGEIVIDRVETKNESPVDDDIVAAHLTIPLGRPFDQDVFSKEVMHLYGLDYFGLIRPTFERREGVGTLSMRVPSKPYGRNSLQLGVGIHSNLEGESSATITARHLLLAANRRGGEWENILQVGERMGFATQFYQPLDAGLNWFVAPEAHATHIMQGIWVDGERVADYRLKEAAARLDAGRMLWNWGEIRAGAFMNRTSGSVATGLSFFPSFDARDGGLHLALNADTLDSTVFPRRGWRLLSDYSHSLESFGADFSNRRASVRAFGAIHLGRSTVVPVVEIDDNIEAEATFGSLYALGGLWRLSGYARNELLGVRAGIAEVVFYQEILKLGLGALKTNIYAGGSAEIGNTFFAGDPVSLDTLRTAGSIFLGADTVIGPTYLAVGFGESGRRQYMLNIGQTF